MNFGKPAKLKPAPTEPDPMIRRMPIKGLQTEIEKHPEARFRLKDLQDEKAESGF
jgi:hypothetical protein